MAFFLLLFSALVTLLSDRQFDTTAARKGDGWFAVGADDLNVADTGGEGSVDDVSDMDNVVTTDVFFSAEDGTNSALVTTTSAHDQISNFKWKGVDDLVLDQVELDGVVDLDDWVRVSNGTTIVSDDERDALVSKLDTLDFAQLVSCFLSADSVDSESALDVEHDSEVFTGFFDGNDIHETGGELGVGSDLVVNFDQSLGDDQGHFTPGQGIFETVTEENTQRKTLSQLVRTRVGSGSVGTTELVEHPRRWRRETLHVLFLPSDTHCEVLIGWRGRVGVLAGRGCLMPEASVLSG